MQLGLPSLPSSARPIPCPPLAHLPTNQVAEEARSAFDAGTLPGWEDRGMSSQPLALPSTAAPAAEGGPSASGIDLEAFDSADELAGVGEWGKGCGCRWAGEWVGGRAGRRVGGWAGLAEGWVLEAWVLGWNRGPSHLVSTALHASTAGH